MSRRVGPPRGRLLRDLADRGYREVRPLQGQFCGLLPFMYTTGLVVGLGDSGYQRRYCYEHLADARAALEAWDGADHPPGPWIKCKGPGIDLLNPAML